MPPDYHNWFKAASRQTGESHVLFANKHMTLLGHYIGPTRAGSVTVFGFFAVVFKTGRFSLSVFRIISISILLESRFP
jgi:hypothetical protein